MSKVSFAVVFTCFNRREITKKCIKSIFNQSDIEADLSLYICDDNSTDGTVDMIKEIAPEAQIIAGDGNLYWSRGMSIAMAEAIKTHHDFYLCINDDLELFDNAFSIMLSSFYSHRSICAVAGCTLSKDMKTATYGGRRFVHGNIGRSAVVLPNDNNRSCDVANLNCFLIPEELIKKVGLIDYRFEHALGDYDYCHAIRRNGYSIYVADQFIGITERNKNTGTSRDKSLSKTRRIKSFFSRKEHPVRSEFYYYFKNYGFPGSIYCFLYYVKSVFTILLNI